MRHVIGPCLPPWHPPPPHTNEAFHPCFTASDLELDKIQGGLQR